MAEYKLIEKLISNSKAEDWNNAKKEWRLNNISFSQKPQTCECGHSPIFEICEIENKINKNKLTVGNHCVKVVLGLPSDKIFIGVKKVRNNINKSLNPQVIEFALDKGWINNQDRQFSIDTWRKRNLSASQLAWRKSINRKIIENIKN